MGQLSALLFRDADRADQAFTNYLSCNRGCPSAEPTGALGPPLRIAAFNTPDTTPAAPMLTVYQQGNTLVTPFDMDTGTHTDPSVADIAAEWARVAAS